MTKKRILSALMAITLVTAMIVPAFAASAAASPRVTSLALGHAHGVALGTDGAVYTWGNNDYGQLGEGSTVSKNSPVSPLSDVISVSAGGIHRFANVTDVYGKLSGHTLAIKSNNTLWAWGENGNGQLGDGTRTQRNYPIQIMTDAVFCAAGGNFSMAIKTDGTLWSWGYNNNGQLGDGTKTTRLSPVKIMDDVVYATGGQNHGLAIKKDGTLWSWGENNCGQLGDGTAVYTNSPVKIMDNVVAASASGVNSAAVKKDGTLWAWGCNTYGQVGDGTRTDRLAPVKIMDGVADVAIGGTQLKLEMTTGWDPVGDPVATPPIPPGPITTEYTVQVGHGFAIKTDGTLWSWGFNIYGQLGTGTTIDQNTPVKILDNIAEVAASGTMGAALTKDGKVLSWGYNINGQLGDGSRTDVRAPTVIMTGIGAASKPAGETANKSSQSVIVNGKAVAFDAYNIGGANYFKLRDLAMALSGSGKQFAVSFDSATATVGITPNRAYTPIGGELATGSAGTVNTNPSTHKVTINDVSVSIAAYNIGGANYFKLRDLMKLIDVFVGYNDATRVITIDTTGSYVD